MSDERDIFLFPNKITCCVHSEEILTHKVCFQGVNVTIIPRLSKFLFLAPKFTQFRHISSRH